MSSEITKFIVRKLKKAILIIFTLCYTILSHGADVCVSNLSPNSDITWTITNREGHVEFSSADYLSQKNCFLELDDEQYYQWNLQANSIYRQDTVLLTLAVNNAVIMAIPNTIAIGEYQSEFKTGSKSPVLKIVGGENASIEDFPWQVFFRFGDYMCGGSIISDRWILTAAHCTQDKEGKQVDVSEMYILVGATNRTNGTGKKYYIKDYIIHENYNNQTLKNDIAVLELTEAIDYPNAEAIGLISNSNVEDGATRSGVMSTVTGWGLTDVNPVTSPSKLQMVELPIVDNSIAATVWGSLSSTVLSAGYKDGHKDACSGDSGGPLIVEFGGIKKIAGIVSYGSEDCDTYGGYTRVSSYLDWIEDKTLVIPPGEIAKPSGELKVCIGTASSVYNTNGGDENSYEWELSPTEAGSLTFNNEEVSISWDPNYIGTAELRVRAKIDGTMTSWRSIYPEIVIITELQSHSKDTIICEGDYLSLEIEALGDMLQYEWYKDDAIYRTTADPYLIFTKADTSHSGAYHCIIKGTCGEAVTEDINLTVWPKTRIESIANKDIDLRQGASSTLSISTRGHELAYQWYKDSITIDHATQASFTLSDVNANDIGRYYAIAHGSCESDTSQQIYVYVDDESLMYNARIWPSVAEDFVHIAISTEFLFDVNIYNMQGILKSQYLDQRHRLSVDISTLPAGIYYLQLESESLEEVFRFIKK